VWGGGIYEPEMFYDLCDELGLCVWQEFMFACAAYPTFDTEFMATVEREAEDTVRRLRHHPCLALWCGNNELEQGLVGPEWTERTMSWEDYEKLFGQLLPEIVARLDPDTAYWPGSPHSPLGNREDWNNPGGATRTSGTCGMAASHSSSTAHAATGSTASSASSRSQSRAPSTATRSRTSATSPLP
jgi:beta-galactosidase/beta-glucuronidase